MKKILAMLLLAALLLASAMPAMAVSAEYASTRAFLKVLDEADIIYTLVGAGGLWCISLLFRDREVVKA